MAPRDRRSELIKSPQLSVFHRNLVVASASAPRAVHPLGPVPPVAAKNHVATLSFDLAELVTLSHHMDEGAIPAPKNGANAFIDFCDSGFTRSSPSSSRR